MKKPTKFVGARIVGEDGLVRTWGSAQDFNNNLSRDKVWNSAQMEQAKEFYKGNSGKRGYEVTGGELSILPFDDIAEASAVLGWLTGDLKRIFDTHQTHTLKSGGLRGVSVDRDAVAGAFKGDLKRRKENEIAEYYIGRMLDGSMSGAVQTIPEIDVKTWSKYLRKGEDLIKYTTPTSATTPYLDFYDLIEVISDGKGGSRVDSARVEVGGNPYKITYELKVPKGTIMEYESIRGDWLSEVPKSGVGGLGFDGLSRLSAVFVSDLAKGVSKVMYTSKQNGKGEVPIWQV